MIKLKEIYEPDLYELQCKVEQLGNFFQLIRNFSFKVSSHLKIMCHLINNLIDSGDGLVVEEKKLSLPPNFSLNLHSKAPLESTGALENELMSKMFLKLRQEESQFNDDLQHGQNNLNFIKNNLHRMAMNKENLAHKPSLNNIDNLSCINPKVQVDDLTVNDCHLETKSQHILNLPTQQTLQDQLKKVSRKMKRLERAKNNDESGMNEILQQLIELKIEKESMLDQKDKEIQEWKEKCQEMKKEISSLKKSLKQMKLQ